MVVSLRKHHVDQGIIGIYHQTGTIPTQYTELCTFQGKQILGIPNACATPDSCVGTACHQHAAEAAHGHSICPSTNCHTHTFSSATGGTSQQFAGGTNGCNAVPTHSHSWPTGSGNPALTVCTTIGTAHPCTSNCPAYITSRYIQKSITSISMRKKTSPRLITFLWDNSLSEIPSEFCKETVFLDKYIKGSCSVGCTAGSNSHTEASAGAHVHNVATASHGHSVSGSSSVGPGRIEASGGGGIGPIATSHTHTIGTLAVTAAGGCTNSCSNGAHTHASICSQPPFRTVMYIRKNSISMRRPGIPKNVISLWKCSVGTIPSCYTNCVNFFNKYAKSVITACTVPGSTGGGCCHQHASATTHTHCASPAHSHSGTGTSGLTPTGTLLSGPRMGRHNHNASGTGVSSPNSPLCAGGCHQHTAQCNIPSSKTVAFLKRT